MGQGPGSIQAASNSVEYAVPMAGEDPVFADGNTVGQGPGSIQVASNSVEYAVPMEQPVPPHAIGQSVDHNRAQQPEYAGTDELNCVADYVGEAECGHGHVGAQEQEQQQGTSGYAAPEQLAATGADAADGTLAFNVSTVGMRRKTSRYDGFSTPAASTDA